MSTTESDEVVRPRKRSAFASMETRRTLRPLLLSILATIESPISLRDLERIVRGRADRILPADAIERDLQALAFVGLVDVDDALLVSLSDDGLLVAQGS